MIRFLPLLASLIVALSSCDCENKIRKTVSDRPVEHVPEQADAQSSRPQEVEPNDTPETATNIELRQELRPIAGELSSPSDVDWFAVHGIPGPYEISVTPEDGLDVSVHLSGKTINHPPVTYNVEGVGQKEILPMIFLSSEPTYFGIRSVGAGAGRYEIAFVRRMIAGNFESEPNDSSNTATILELSGEIQGMFERPDDRDVFVIKSEEDTKIRLDFRPAPNLPQRLRIFGDERFQTPIINLTIEEGQREATIPVLAMSAGKELYVELSSISGFDRQAFYTLKSTRLSGISNEIEVEPNDITPMVLEFPGVVRGNFYSPDDVDRFTIGTTKDVPPEPTAAQGKRRWENAMNLRVRALREPLKYGLAIAFPDGERRFESQEDGKVQVCGARFRSGELDVSIRPVGWSPGDAVFDYEIATEDLGGIEGFEIEPNDDRENADVLEEFRIGILEGSDAKDFYVFEVGAGGDHIGVSVGGKGVDVALRVEDYEGGLIAESNLPGAAIEKLNFDLPEGRYFLVVSFGGTDVPSCQPYRVNLRRDRGVASEGEKGAQDRDEQERQDEEKDSRDEQWP